MKPVCVPCERFYRPKKNGYYFVEGMPHSHPTEPWDGNEGRGSVGWAPYKVWVGDLWECPTCKAQIVVGVAPMPVREHFEAGFDAVVECTKATQLLVKDC